jgi:hypothetical protein
MELIYIFIGWLNSENPVFRYQKVTSDRESFFISIDLIVTWRTFCQRYREVTTYHKVTETGRPDLRKRSYSGGLRKKYSLYSLNMECGCPKSLFPLSICHSELVSESHISKFRRSWNKFRMTFGIAQPPTQSADSKRDLHAGRKLHSQPDHECCQR